MKRLHLAVLAAATVVGLGGAAFAAVKVLFPKEQPITQPIAFNHAKHTGDGEHSPKLACVECHTGVEKQAIAGLPSLDMCLRCHMKPQSDTEEEGRVREIAAKGGPFAFRQVTRNAGHVYFSHRAHVSGKPALECAACHGDVTAWTAPPDHSEARLKSMDACMDCHRNRGGPTSCLACHK